jgi:hypothetical protein
MSKSPKDRPQNAAELLKILQRTKIFKKKPTAEDIV